VLTPERPTIRDDIRIALLKAVRTCSVRMARRRRGLASTRGVRGIGDFPDRRPPARTSIVEAGRGNQRRFPLFYTARNSSLWSWRATNLAKSPEHLANESHTLGGGGRQRQDIDEEGKTIQVRETHHKGHIQGLQRA
jgi:hypothetical protein